MCTYEEIEKANETIRTTDIKGKSYAEVNQRIKAFRMVHPNGCISTEIISLTNGVVTMKTSVYDENGKLLGTGFAQEKEDSTFINKTSFIENCETSSVGRAIAIATALGVDVSVASAEEVQNAMNNQPKQNRNEPNVERITKAQYKQLEDKFGLVELGRYLKKRNYRKGSEITNSEFAGLMLVDSIDQMVVE